MAFYASGVGLELVLTDGRIEIDNNSVERTTRPIPLNRKSRLLTVYSIELTGFSACPQFSSICRCCFPSLGYCHNVEISLHVLGDGTLFLRVMLWCAKKRWIVPKPKNRLCSARLCRTSSMVASLSLSVASSRRTPMNQTKADLYGQTDSFRSVAALMPRPKAPFGLAHCVGVAGGRFLDADHRHGQRPAMEWCAYVPLTIAAGEKPSSIPR